MNSNTTIAANIKVHSQLVKAGEYQRSPHFRQENIQKVKGILAGLCRDLPPKEAAKAVDFGCGTGFIVHLIKDRFSEVHGVDITVDMMKEIDLSSGNITLHECLAEKTPFESDTFDFASAYSFMDHLFDYKIFLKEVHRVLKPGGLFFSDLNPNRAFISQLKLLESQYEAIDSQIVAREIEGALHNGEYYESEFGVSREELDNAEPGKSVNKGFDAIEVKEFAEGIGFTNCTIEHEWFMGQGKVMHGESHELAGKINDLLISILPASSSLFKYLRFIFIK
jgi:ubiquinone/menaquinone biosynthesis C-methylase UbiE